MQPSLFASSCRNCCTSTSYHHPHLVSYTLNSFVRPKLHPAKEAPPTNITPASVGSGGETKPARGDERKTDLNESKEHVVGQRKHQSRVDWRVCIKREATEHNQRLSDEVRPQIDSSTNKQCIKAADTARRGLTTMIAIHIVEGCAPPPK